MSDPLSDLIRPIMALADATNEAESTCASLFISIAALKADQHQWMLDRRVKDE